MIVIFIKNYMFIELIKRSRV